MRPPHAASLTTAVVLGSCLLSACDRDLVTPERDSREPPEAGYVMVTLADVHDRLLPALDDAETRDRLAAIDPGSAEPGTHSLPRPLALLEARATLEALIGQADAGLDPADLDAMLLGIDYAITELQLREDR